MTDNCEDTCAYIQPVLAGLRAQLAAKEQRIHDLENPEFPEIVKTFVQLMPLGDGAAHQASRNVVRWYRLMEDRLVEMAALRKAFEHTHQGPGDSCGKCGLDIRNEIHVRVAAAPEGDR